VNFTSDWFSWQIPNWERWLSPLKGKEIYALEIGCYEGRSSCWLLENILTNPNSELTCVDTFSCGEDLPEVKDNSILKRFEANIAKWKDKIEICVADSKDCLPEFIFHSRKYDFIYIDGSHIPHNVLRDAIFGWDLLAKDGILIFDDYGWEQDPNPLMRPKLAIDSFLQIFEGKYKLLGKDWQVAIQKL
jgi:predicted O-methyltransferase YrrM